MLQIGFTYGNSNSYFEMIMYVYSWVFFIYRKNYFVCNTVENFEIVYMLKTSHVNFQKKRLLTQLAQELLGFEAFIKFVCKSNSLFIAAKSNNIRHMRSLCKKARTCDLVECSDQCKKQLKKSSVLRILGKRKAGKRRSTWREK